MKLTIILKKAISGYWDGGKKREFEWELQSKPKHDENGYFVQVGSWIANEWFMIGCGKTKIQSEKQILSNLKTLLHKRLLKQNLGIESMLIT